MVWEKFFSWGCLPVNRLGWTILSGRKEVFDVLSLFFEGMKKGEGIENEKRDDEGDGSGWPGRDEFQG
jgi:hypothetical protein